MLAFYTENMTNRFLNNTHHDYITTLTLPVPYDDLVIDHMLLSLIQ